MVRIRTIGLGKYFQTLGYEDAELNLHIQIAYSFNGGTSWVNDFGEDIMGTEYYPNIETEEAPNGLEKYEAAPIPGVEEALYQSEGIFNLRNYHPEWYNKGTYRPCGGLYDAGSCVLRLSVGLENVEKMGLPELPPELRK